MVGARSIEKVNQMMEILRLINGEALFSMHARSPHAEYRT